MTRRVPGRLGRTWRRSKGEPPTVRRRAIVGRRVSKSYEGLHRPHRALIRPLPQPAQARQDSTLQPPVLGNARKSPAVNNQGKRSPLPRPGELTATNMVTRAVIANLSRGGGHACRRT